MSTGLMAVLSGNNLAISPLDVEGLTWLRSAPLSPVGNGTLAQTGILARSQSKEAWSGGRVG